PRRSSDLAAHLRRGCHAGHRQAEPAAAARSLRDLAAGIRVDDRADGLAFDTSADALAGMSLLNLRTRYGDLDLSFEPAGTEGYDDLTRAAQPRPIAGIRVQVASLAHIIRSSQVGA